MTNKTYFTSEYVSPGHPDKIADQISDAVLDACLSEDANSRVACETFCTTGQVIVGGEITTNTYVDIQTIVRNKIDEIGYRQGMGFDSDCGVLNAIHSQSPDISQGVDTGGAGDQGIMFGGAVDETPELMPLALVLSREIIRKLTTITKSGELTWARPDAKSQVTLAYDENGNVDHVETVVVSVQHNPEVSNKTIKEDIIKLVITPVLESYELDVKKVNHFHINPTGRFVIKDPSKVDRSAAYAARWVAKTIVGAKLATKCEVQLSYAIGVKHPTSIKVDTFGTGTVEEISLGQAIMKIFDLSPRGIEGALELRNPKFKYQDLAAFGHIGRTDIDLPWERLNKIEELKKVLNL